MHKNLGVYCVDVSKILEFNVYTLNNPRDKKHMTTQTEKKASPAAEPPAEDWHPSDVVAALHKAGWTMKALAEEHNLSTGTTLSRALTQSYPASEKRIAAALGLHPKDIWPSRYYENGEIGRAHV